MTMMTMVKAAGAMVIVALVAGCQVAPPPDLEAAPTDEELRILGGDAYDDYFLTRWRKCTQFASTSTCEDELYGGDGGGGFR
jgi:hypothetical protein